MNKPESDLGGARAATGREHQPGSGVAGSEGNSGGGELLRHLTLRVVTMPRDTNHYGTIFGGVILSYIDQAGFVEARRHGAHKWVTAALDRVEFKSPVQVGDTVNLYARTIREGRTSVTIEVEVEAERFTTGQVVPVTSATLTMVAIGPDGRSIPFRVPAP
ncbi:MAG: acyl-CoA thioesterase [Planctomycetota bacterium]|nr:acyl-CoA thioesterase [Planctomycetota bacterium]